ncbi:MAG: chemotaxis protein CheX [Lachnospiraceae bacterium]|nr:chemotaxis protein CheX [Lachnospiraceae bacterium]
MVAIILGTYLQKKGLLTYEQLENLLLQQRRIHVKLGLIAVSEGLMMQEETDKINEMQAAMDKKFGDIAIEQGYLTEGEVEALLKKQGNAYLKFAQALEDQQLMTVEQLEQYMMDFQMENQMTFSDMEDLKSGDVDRILPLYIPAGQEKYLDAMGTALRTIMRCVDTEIYFEKAYVASECEGAYGAIQCIDGERSLSCGMIGKGQALLPVASAFGKEEFEEMNEDALDAIGELLNCISGLYASGISRGGVYVELYPPEYSTDICGIFCDEMLVLPIYIKGQKIHFTVAIGNKIEMKQEA